ncbi:histidine phosphatase family protein [uncultured Cohaesibacter sp.]|uniref:SixA phosphatase family protein n=1 Tax=uncultured Cohaesibacter sp. TaxID=1002546 RepID=UPI0029C66FC0|nr:histidine phosphatase family protein [uncultured Cohaesibacter sp.]
MLRLFLLRHAKSSWSDPSLHDFDRPLNKRGLSDSPKIATAMRERNYHPDRILCSSAQRTKETMAGIIPSLTGEVSLHLMEALYEGNSPDYLSLIRANAKKSKQLMVVGHNTGLHETAIRLVGSGNKDMVSLLREKFPTAGLVVIDFRCKDWHDVKPKTGRLIDFIKPRDIKSDPDLTLIENPAPTFFRR